MGTQETLCCMLSHRHVILIITTPTTKTNMNISLQTTLAIGLMRTTMGHIVNASAQTITTMEPCASSNIILITETLQTITMQPQTTVDNNQIATAILDTCNFPLLSCHQNVQPHNDKMTCIMLITMTINHTGMKNEFQQDCYDPKDPYQEKPKSTRPPNHQSSTHYTNLTHDQQTTQQ